MELAHAASRRVRAHRQIFDNSDDGSLADASHTALTWEIVASRIRPSSDSKSPRPISRRGLQLFCDDDDMPVICPTCQTLKVSAANFYSNPCTGGALLPPASAGLAIGSGDAAAAASS